MDEVEAMRLLVCGGRGFRDRAWVYRELERLQPELVITGGCRTGADAYARQWAYARARPFMSMPANWEKLGRPAGPIRNAWLAKFAPATHCLAFPGGNGTADMVKKARRAGWTVLDLRTSI